MVRTCSLIFPITLPYFMFTLNPIYSGKPAYSHADFWSIKESLEHHGPPRLRSDVFSQELCDLIACMLQMKDDQRLTATQLLAHPFFQNNELTPQEQRELVYSCFEQRLDVSGFGHGDDSEFTRVVDVVVGAHFHGLLRMNKSAIPPAALAMLEEKDRKRARREAKRLKKVANEAEENARMYPDRSDLVDAAKAARAAANASLAALERDKRNEIKNETETNNSKSDSNFLWVQGYRPILPEDEVRFERIADIYNIPVRYFINTKTTFDVCEMHVIIILLCVVHSTYMSQFMPPFSCIIQVDDVRRVFEEALRKKRDTAKGLHVVIPI